MKMLFQSRKFRGLGIVALCALVGYALFGGGDDVAVVQNKAQAQLEAAPSGQPAPQGKGSPLFAILAQNGSRFANLNPKEYALKDSDYGGHPAYNKATRYLACADYQASKKDTAQDLAEQGAGGQSNEALEFAKWFNVLKEEQCKSFTQADLLSVPALMHTAAQAGDVGAQSYELGQEVGALRQAAEARMRDNPGQPQDLGQHGKSLLARANALAERGDRDAAFLAAQLSGSDEFGQKDLVASAAWAMVGMQQKGELFSATNRVFEVETYAELSAEQRQTAAQSAQVLFARCCDKR